MNNQLLTPTQSAELDGKFLDEIEWKRRFVARIVEQLADGFTPEGAKEAAEHEYDAVSDPAWNPGYMEEPPEESADECLSCWDADED